MEKSTNKEKLTLALTDKGNCIPLRYENNQKLVFETTDESGRIPEKYNDNTLLLKVNDCPRIHFAQEYYGLQM